MKSYLLTGIICAAVIAIATLIYALVLPHDQIEDDIETASVSEQIVTTAPDTNQTIVTTQAEEAADDVAEDGYKLVIDIARVQADGMAVFAGKGAPNGTIFIIKGGAIFAQNIIDEQGEWVVLPDEALSPGAHLLQLEMVTLEGERQRADVSLVVEISQNGDEKPLVALVPQSEDQSPQLLQSPDDEKPVETPGEKPADEAPTVASEKAPATEAEQVAEILGQDEIFIQIGSLSYDDEARLSVHGVASGGKWIAGTMADETLEKVALASSGRWSSSIQGSPFASGDRQNLTINLLNDANEVLAQTALMVSRAQLSAGLDGSLMVVVHKGDALWRIAYRSYGEGVRYVDIFRRNAEQIDDPDLIYPNQIFAVPGVKSE